MTAKERLLRLAEHWSEAQARTALRAVEEDTDSESAKERAREIDDAIVDGYTRIPPGQIDEWGDLDAQVAALSTLTLQRLDDEERDAGHESWLARGGATPGTGA